jgi:hypothetical protein
VKKIFHPDQFPKLSRIGAFEVLPVSFSLVKSGDSRSRILM